MLWNSLDVSATINLAASEYSLSAPFFSVLASCMVSAKRTTIKCAFVSKDDFRVAWIKGSSKSDARGE